VQLLRGCWILRVHIHHEVGVDGKKRHLAFRIATISAVCVGLDKRKTEKGCVHIEFALCKPPLPPTHRRQRPASPFSLNSVTQASAPTFRLFTQSSLPAREPGAHQIRKHSPAGNSARSSFIRLRWHSRFPQQACNGRGMSAHFETVPRRKRRAPQASLPAGRLRELQLIAGYRLFTAAQARL
jgi:hypothetical protein